ncbi:MAG TPA: CDP-diacylglycerol--serine O-phosphatidyltransferase [Spirochaetota bacterium]|nr:CDP-diacylglycerol--serine O-phosphatidyltransferase [Spirochaetota bacterium]
MNLAWMPNSLTMGNLLCGFTSVIFASAGTPQGFMVAGLLIMGAALLDGLDGPIARALKVDSTIGAELDSLADCVTFGVAPGYLAYQAYLSGMIVPVFGKSVDMGIFLASIFPICAAYRLARFNVTHVSNSFSGLPSPVAGIVIALVPVCFHGDEIPRIGFAVFFVIIALLMVSTFRYQKPQASLLKSYHRVKLLLFFVIIVLLIVFLKQWAVFVVISIYILSGILSFVIQLIQDHKY